MANQIMIYRNSAKCLKCNEELISRSRHDYVTCKCGSLSVDGGRDYLKRRGKSGQYHETSITSDAPFQAIREALEWGSYGKSGDEDLRFIKLKDLEESHIFSIMKTQNLRVDLEQLFLKELKFRG